MSIKRFIDFLPGRLLFVVPGITPQVAGFVPATSQRRLRVNATGIRRLAGPRPSWAIVAWQAFHSRFVDRQPGAS